MNHDPDCPFADQGDAKSCWCLTEEPQGNIVIADTSNLTIQGSTLVTIKDALVLRHQGQVVSVDATYEFANVPPELHCLLLNLLMQQRQVHSYL